MNPVYPEAKSFLAYLRYEDDDSFVSESVEFSCLGEELPMFFSRCVENFRYDLLIVFSCTPTDLKEVLRIE